MSGLEALAGMKYSGRGIIVGQTPEGNIVVGYSLTGRSRPSQARELLEGSNTRTIRTSVTDPKVLEQGSRALLIYPAVIPVGNGVAVSNGVQTELIYSAARRDPSRQAIDVIYNFGKVIISHFSVDVTTTIMTAVGQI